MAAVAGERDARMHHVMDQFVREVRQWSNGSTGTRGPQCKDVAHAHVQEIYEAYRRSGLQSWEFHTMIHEAKTRGLVADIEPLWSEVGDTFVRFGTSQAAAEQARSQQASQAARPPGWGVPAASSAGQQQQQQQQLYSVGRVDGHRSDQHNGRWDAGVNTSGMLQPHGNGAASHMQQHQQQGSYSKLTEFQQQQAADAAVAAALGVQRGVGQAPPNGVPPGWHLGGYARQQQHPQLARHNGAGASAAHPQAAMLKALGGADPGKPPGLSGWEQDSQAPDAVLGQLGGDREAELLPSGLLDDLYDQGDAVVGYPRTPQLLQQRQHYQRQQLQQQLQQHPASNGVAAAAAGLAHSPGSAASLQAVMQQQLLRQQAMAHMAAMQQQQHAAAAAAAMQPQGGGLGAYQAAYVQMANGSLSPGARGAPSSLAPPVQVPGLGLVPSQLQVAGFGLGGMVGMAGGVLGGSADWQGGFGGLGGPMVAFPGPQQQQAPLAFAAQRQQEQQQQQQQQQPPPPQQQQQQVQALHDGAPPVLLEAQQQGQPGQQQGAAGASAAPMAHDAHPPVAPAADAPSAQQPVQPLPQAPAPQPPQPQPQPPQQQHQQQPLPAQPQVPPPLQLEQPQSPQLAPPQRVQPSEGLAPGATAGPGVSPPPAPDARPLPGMVGAPADAQVSPPQPQRTLSAAAVAPGGSSPQQRPSPLQPTAQPAAASPPSPNLLPCSALAPPAAALPSPAPALAAAPSPAAAAMAAGAGAAVSAGSSPAAGVGSAEAAASPSPSLLPAAAPSAPGASPSPSPRANRNAGRSASRGGSPRAPTPRSAKPGTANGVGAAAAAQVRPAAAPAAPAPQPVLTYAQRLSLEPSRAAAHAPPSQPRVAPAPRTAAAPAAVAAAAADGVAGPAGVAAAAAAAPSAQLATPAAGGAATAAAPAGADAATGAVAGGSGGRRSAGSRLSLPAKLIDALRQGSSLQSLLKLVAGERPDLGSALNERIRGWLTQDCDRQTAECLVAYVLGNLRRDWRSSAKSPGAFLMGVLQHRCQLLSGRDGLNRHLLALAKSHPNVAVYVDSDVIQELGEMEPQLRSFILTEYVAKQRHDWPEGLKFPSQCLLSCMRSIRYADPSVHKAYMALMEGRPDLAKAMNGVILYGLCKCDTSTGLAAIRKLRELPEEWTAAARVNASAFLYQKVQELCGHGGGGHY